MRGRSPSSRRIRDRAPSRGSSPILNSSVPSKQPDISTGKSQHQKHIFAPIYNLGSSIFIGNLPFDCSKDDLTEIFCKYRRLLDVFIPTFPGINKPRGYAFVRFRYKQDARAAIEILNDGRIDGRKVSVRWAKPKSQHFPKSQQQQRPSTTSENPRPPSYAMTVLSKFHLHQGEALDDINTVADI
ncbi:serine/arginine-rich splicing factor SC35-like [Magnolia sinica]|uniref:serine/arginine-rich splicing factor SC35-like n=1 Tax=Magnolia sinica TaxID=86752 RepID=UPI00265A261F|nr:serine/arginine-rich splicing factor SC35-like [Magnolia sinica]